MKLTTPLLILLLLLLSLSEAKAQYYNPNSSLRESNEAFHKAIEHQNERAITDALCAKIEAQLALDKGEIPSLIEECEKLLEKPYTHPTQALLHSMAATLYQQMYREKSYTYSLRTPITPRPREMAQWSDCDFWEEIFRHTFASLENREELLVENTRSLPLINEKESYSSLYHLLSAQALERLRMHYNPAPLAKRYTPEPLNDSTYFLPEEEFLQLPLSPSPHRWVESIRYIYQELMRSHREQNEEEAAITESLARLAYERSNQRDNNPLRYIASLRELERTSRHNTLYPKVIDTLARTLLQQEGYAPRAEALRLCQEADSPELQPLIAEITAPDITLLLANTRYPQHASSLSLRCTNVLAVQCNIYREKEGERPSADSPMKEQLRQMALTHSFKVDFLDTLSLVAVNEELNLPPLPLGRYVVMVESNHYAQYIPLCVTRYAATTVGHEVIVADGASGKPLGGVTVELYGRGGWGGQTPLNRHVITNKQGGATLPHELQIGGIRTLQGADSLAFVTPLWLDNSSDTPTEWRRLQLFTDRAIYRTGDSLHCTGILYRTSLREGETLAKETITLQLRNARYQTIATQEVTTDAWGGFSTRMEIPQEGLTGRYSLVEQASHTSLPIEVVEYKRPALQVEVESPEGLLAFGNEVTLRGHATSFTGALLEGASVHYTLRRNNYNSRMGGSELLHKGETTVEEDGAFAIRFTPTPPPVEESYRFNYTLLEVTVTSLTGETEETTLPLHIGKETTRLELSLPAQLKREELVPLDLEVEQLAGRKEPIAGECRLYTLEGSHVSEETPLDSLACSKLRWNSTFTTDSLPTDLDWSRLPSGAYRLIVTLHPPHAEAIQQESNLLLYSERDKMPPYPTRLWIPETYIMAHSAQEFSITLGSSFKDCYTSLLLFEGEKLLERKVERLDEGNREVRFSSSTPYAYPLQLVAVTLYQGRLYKQHITVNEPIQSRQLTVTCNTFRNYLTPNSKERWELSVTDERGKGVADARLLVTLFDAALNQLRPHRWLFTPQLGRGYTASLRSAFSIRTHYGTSLYGEDWNNGMLRDEMVIVAYGKQNKAMVTGSVERAEATEADDAAVTPPLRNEFAPTACFNSHLTTNPSGRATMEFTLPPSNTTWQLNAVAYTQHLRYGNLTQQWVATKPLTAMCNAPRFVRPSDSLTVPTLVSNLTDSIQCGTLHFSLVTSEEESPLWEQSIPFTLAPHSSLQQNFTPTIPSSTQPLALRVVATTQQGASDGEQHPLVVLPKERRVEESFPLWIGEGDSLSHFHLARVAELLADTTYYKKLTFNYTNHPMGYVVEALPTLLHESRGGTLQLARSLFVQLTARYLAQNYPDVAESIRQWKGNEKEQITLWQGREPLQGIALEQTPWVEHNGAETSLALLLDSVETTRLSNQLITQLISQQLSDGGWAWFAGGGSSLGVTLEVVETVTRLQELGALVLSQEASAMLHRAIAYLDKSLLAQPNYTSMAIRYLRMRSAHLDIPLGDALTAHKALIHKLIVERESLSLQERAWLAPALYRYGFQQEGKEMLRSLLGYAITDKEGGIRWNNTSSTEAAIVLQCSVIEGYNELLPQERESLARMEEWLLLQKRSQAWGSSSATVEAIYSLLRSTREGWSQSAEFDVLRWGDRELPTQNAQGIMGYRLYQQAGKRLPTQLSNITVERNASTPAWGALFLQYEQEEEEIEASSHPTGITLKRNLFVCRHTERGEELIPLETTHVKVGETVEVQLLLACDVACDYLLLRDERAANLEAIAPLAGRRYSEGVSYYVEQGVSGTNLFLEELPRGEFLLRYRVRCDREGAYSCGIASVKSLYTPEISAHTAGGKVISFQK